MSYERFDHTGDLGIVVTEPTYEELCRTSARALFDILVDAPHRPGTDVETIHSGEDFADLLRSWLADLLYNFSTHGTILDVGSVVVQKGPRLLVRGSVRTFDPDRDGLRTELKAVTYHQLEVRQNQDGWTARVVFDV